MKIVLATSEAVPFAKTGGLADVCGALPLELRALGHQVVVIMPAYRSVFAGGRCESSRPEFSSLFPSVARRSPAGCCADDFPGSDVPVYFVDQPNYFDRDDFYQAGGQRLSRQLRTLRVLQPRGAGGGPAA